MTFPGTRHQGDLVSVRSRTGGLHDHDTTGYLSSDGVYSALPGSTPGSGKNYQAMDLPSDVVMRISRDAAGKLRSADEQARIAAIANRYNFPTHKDLQK